MTDLANILSICTRDALIAFPLVLGVGLLYSHLRVLDVSVDAVAVLAGITCAIVWRESQSYSLSLASAILCGIGCSWIVCILTSKLAIEPIMSGLVFAIVVYATSILLVGESVPLLETSLLPGFLTFPWWLPAISVALIVAVHSFFGTRLGAEIRAVGNNRSFGTSYSPFLLAIMAYSVAGALYGFSAGLYVHGQGVARSGGGFEFLVFALCAYLSVDRLLDLVERLFYRVTRKGGNDQPPRMFWRIGGSVIRTPAVKAVLGSLCFQLLVFVSILHSPDPAYWKLIMAGILAASLATTGGSPRPRRQRDHGRPLPAALGGNGEAELSVESLSKAYDLGVDRRTIFEEVTFGLRVGTNLVRGPNGAGKSTLLRILAGEVHCDKGVILLDGEAVSAEHRHRRPTFLIQQNPFATLATDLSVVDNLNLALPRSSQPCGGFLSGEKTLDLLFRRLADVRLTAIASRGSSLWHKPAGTLSGGQAVCIACYMALLSEKKVVLADEPSTGLDTENFSRLVVLLEELASDRIVILTTHDHRLDVLDARHYSIRDHKLLVEE